MWFFLFVIVKNKKSLQHPVFNFPSQFGVIFLLPPLPAFRFRCADDDADTDAKTQMHACPMQRYLNAEPRRPWNLPATGQ